MSDIPMIHDAPREKISEYARQLDLKFDRTDIAAGAKEIWGRMRKEFDGFGKCHYCKKESGAEHTFEECVARTHGRIDQLYQPKKS